MEIVNKIIDRIEDSNDDITVIWPTSYHSKLTKDKFIIGIEKAYNENIALYLVFGYSCSSSFSRAINNIISIKDRPEQIHWKQYFLNIINLKLCPSCLEIKEVKDFNTSNNMINGKQCYCKTCANDSKKQHRKEIKIYLLNKYFNSGCSCSICSYNSNLAALDIHHIDKTEKRPEWAINTSPSSYLYDCSIELAEKRIKNELYNLDVLCLNCHQEIHNISEIDKQIGLKDALGEINIEYKCEICSENERLHLHHNDERDEKAVSFCYFNNQPKNKILLEGTLEKEMKKNVSILCGNHHREIHNPKLKLA